MTEHLPECAVAVALPGTFTSCICEALRACEERVLNAAVQRVEEQAAMWQEQTLTRLGIGIALAAINKGQS